VNGRLTRKKVPFIGFRISAADYDALDALAIKANTSISNFVKSVALEKVSERDGSHGAQGNPATGEPVHRHETAPVSLADLDQPEQEPIPSASVEPPPVSSAPAPPEKIQIRQSWGNLTAEQRREKLALFKDAVKPPADFKTWTPLARITWLDDSWPLDSK
jgi:hypothetical protein